MTSKVSIDKVSGVYVLRSKQLINADINTVWDYFSTPQNLEKITPDDLSFKITSGVQDKMYPGQLITYKIGILPLITSNWVTEISQVKQGSYFIDEQKFGPYKYWHHTHKFTSVDEGVEMEDVVYFKLPFGVLGNLAYKMFVKSKLTKIFEFRYQHVESIF